MELKKIKENDKSLLVEVAGESFTVTNAMREYLWDDKSVSEAAQIKEHPYLSQHLEAGSNGGTSKERSHRAGLGPYPVHFSGEDRVAADNERRHQETYS